jgi:hypothetical protein
MAMKTCSSCKETKTLTDFYKDKYRKDGLACRCKACDTLSRHKYVKNNPATVVQSRRKKKLKRYYGLTLEDYQQKLEGQNYSCSICKTTDNKVGDKQWSFVVDHCHETGKIRGLLCNQCNRALGMFQDSVDILEKATAYLKSYK